MIRALHSASCVIRHQTGGTVGYGHWFLHLVLSDKDMGYDFLQALGSASCVVRHEAGGTIRYGHWFLHIVLSLTREAPYNSVNKRYVSAIFQPRQQEQHSIRKKDVCQLWTSSGSSNSTFYN